MITSALTIDVEDWFQVSNLEPYVPRDRWADFSLTVERNVDTILALLSEKQIRATFFILGWIADRVPSLVRKIAGEGHEIASHGWDHQRVSALSPAAFADDVKRSRDVLEQISAGPVLGYRAPSFSIDAERQWAHSILAEQGYQYSSSVAPFQHDHYGWPGAPRFAWRPLSGSPFLEVPVSTVRFGRWCLPAGGGRFFQVLSLFLVALPAASDRPPRPACYFLLPPLGGGPVTAPAEGSPYRVHLRTNLNRAAVPARLARLLKDLRWGPLKQIVARHQESLL